MKFYTIAVLLFLIGCGDPAPEYAPLTGVDLSTSPVIIGDSVLFHYDGPATSVSWNGDFNGWGRADSIPNKGTKHEGTGVWYMVTSFPQNARTDYKIVADSSNWILDPKNPHQQWGGAGPNSELRMPQWVASPAEGQKPTQNGRVKGPFTHSSQALGYDVSYRVYLPDAFSISLKYPVLYVTDGHEYIDEKLGNLVHTADWLISNNKTQKFMIVAVDPRNTQNPQQNRRMEELVRNPDYARFITRELPDAVESLFPARSDAAGRALMGTSLGGLFTTWIYANYPGYFGNYAIQSPAYWVHPPIFDEVAEARQLPANIYLMAGSMFDGLDNTRRMRTVLQQKNVNLAYVEANEGHSWGFWRARIHEPLIQFFPYEPNL